MDSYAIAANEIIKQQGSIIGPLALDQARKVSGLMMDNSGVISGINGNGKDVLEKLVKQFEKLFGQASVEACKDAVREINPPIPSNDLPAILQ